MWHDGTRIAVLLGTDGSLTPAEVAMSATGLAELVFILDDAMSGSVLRKVAEGLAPTILAHFNDIDECISAVRQLGVRSVVTFVDGYCRLAAEMNAGLGSLPASQPWLGRKDVQRELLFGAGVSRVRSLRADTANSLREFIGEVGYPVVVKPVDGVASRDIWILRQDGDTAEFLRDTRADRLNGTLAEEFITGTAPAAPQLADYVSAETFRAGEPGELRTVCSFVTDRLAPGWPCRESGLLVPSTLPPASQDAAVRTAERALDALAAGPGAFHTELKPASPEPEIIEVNGRLGGFVARLARYAADADLGRLALSCAAGLEAAPVELRWRRCALVLLFQAPAGATVIRQAPSRRELARQPGVVAVDEVARVGTAIDWRQGTNRAAARLWLVSDDHEAQFRHLSGVCQLLAERFEFADENGHVVRDRRWLEQVGGNGA